MAVIDPNDDSESPHMEGPTITRQGVEARIKDLLAAGVKESAYEALQLFSSQAKRQVKDGDVTAGVGTALEGATALIDQGYPEKRRVP
ncbi:hypothetical protein VYU27_008331 [Nannochloropsis oceanica]